MAVFRLYWNKKVNETEATAIAIKADILESEKQIQKLISRIVETTTDRVISALENRIDELE